MKKFFSLLCGFALIAIILPVTKGADIDYLARNLLTATLDINTPETSILVANNQDQTVASFKLSATEQIEVTEIYLRNDLNNNGITDTNESINNRISTLKIYIGSNLIGSKIPDKETKFVLTSDKKIVIPKNSNVVFTVKADFNYIENADQTNKTFRFSFFKVRANLANSGYELKDNNVTNVTVIGETDKYEKVTANLQYLRKTKPTLTTQTLSSSKLISGEQTIYKVAIAADAKENIEVGSITFNINGKINGKTLSNAINSVKEINNSNPGGTTSSTSTSSGGCNYASTSTSSGGCRNTSTSTSSGGCNYASTSTSSGGFSTSTSSGGATIATTIKGFKLYIAGTQVEISDYILTVNEIGTTDNFAIRFDFNDNKIKSISAGTSKVFELKATVNNVVSDDYISVKILEDKSFASGNLSNVKTLNNKINDNTLANDNNAYFIWSDNSGVPHTVTTTDWFNGKEVTGLDTFTTTLQN